MLPWEIIRNSGISAGTFWHDLTVTRKEGGR
jgi:hypothetical protein